MHGAHPQTMAFYNNGDGASQEIVDWWWCITKVVHLQVEKHKRTNASMSGCKCCMKLQ